MPEIKDLQKLIEERAASKLKKDLQDLHNILYDHPLFNRAKDGPPPPIYLSKNLAGTEVKEIPLYSLLSMDRNDITVDKSLRGELYRFWLPIYIERESAELLKKVDELVSSVDDLLTFKDQQESY